MKQIHGGEIYQYDTILDFSANINPLGVPKRVTDAIRESLSEIWHYPDPFCEKLRQAIAEKEGVKPEQVICGNGAADLIYRLMYAKRPKRALVVAPCFAEYEQALVAAGAEVEHFYLSKTDFLLDTSFLDALQEEIDFVALCSPNNPTGRTIAPDLLQRIIEECQKKNIFLLLDECFYDFLEKPRASSMVQIAKRQNQIFILKAFTKMYALAGVRLGYGICSDEQLLELMYQSGAPWNVSTLAQEAGLAALQESEYAAVTRKVIEKERAYLEQELCRLNITFWPSEANYIFFQSRPGLKAELIEEGILIRNCANYVGLEEGYYRIAVKTHEENEKLVAALARRLAG